MLNEKQIKEFKKNGFVLIRQLFDKSETELILKYTEELQKAPEISGKEWKYFEESKLNKSQKVLARIENFCKYICLFSSNLKNYPTKMIISG